MKKLLSILSVAAVMTACNSNSEADTAAQLQAYKDSVKLAADTAGFADFRNWKAQNELADVRDYNQMQEMAVAPAGTVAYAAAPVRKTSKARSVSSGNRSRNYSGGSMNSVSSNAAKKRGWSKAAKGTAIGAGSGAVIGAVVNKRNRVVGGVLGGVVGGAVGYGIGRGMDKRDGRY